MLFILVTSLLLYKINSQVARLNPSSFSATSSTLYYSSSLSRQWPASQAINGPNSQLEWCDWPNSNAGVAIASASSMWWQLDLKFAHRIESVRMKGFNPWGSAGTRSRTENMYSKSVQVKACAWSGGSYCQSCQQRMDLFTNVVEDVYCGGFLARYVHIDKTQLDDSNWHFCHVSVVASCSVGYTMQSSTCVANPCAPASFPRFGSECDNLRTDGSCTRKCSPGYANLADYGHIGVFGYYTCPGGSLRGHLTCTAVACPGNIPSGPGYGGECANLISDGSCTQTCLPGYVPLGGGVYTCPGGTLTGHLTCNAGSCPRAPTSGPGYGGECANLFSDGSCTQTCLPGYVPFGTGVYTCPGGTLTGNLTCIESPCRNVNVPHSIVYSSAYIRQFADNIGSLYNGTYASLPACSEAINSDTGLSTTGLNSEWFVAEENDNIHRCRVDCFKNSKEKRSVFKKVNTVPTGTLVSSAKNFSTTDGNWSHDAKGITFTNGTEEFYFPTKCSQCNA